MGRNGSANGYRASVSLTVGPRVVDEAIRATALHLRSMRADDDAIQCLTLAITEAIGNVVRHASPQGRARIDITYQRAGSNAVITVTDFGPGFRLRKCPMPEPHAERGRGIPMMLSICDGVKYQVSKTGNRLRLLKHIDG